MKPRVGKYKIHPLKHHSSILVKEQTAFSSKTKTSILNEAYLYNVLHMQQFQNIGVLQGFLITFQKNTSSCDLRNTVQSIDIDTAKDDLSVLIFTPGCSKQGRFN